MRLKRAVDVVVASSLLLAAAPAMLAVAALVRATSPGPAIFRQTRVGRGGEPFTLYKFRSMAQVPPGAGQDAGPHFTAAGDPRVTPVGRFIRRTSLDELPQLWNVLRGDMSLVGPRPDVPAQRGGYTDEEWTLRHAVRPGITGLAQATLRSAATEDERKALDLAYVRAVSLREDLRIAWLTVRQVLGKGSY